MNPRPPTPVSLFDKYTLGIPPRSVCYEDGKLGQRILFISDQRETFTVSFEEGMKLMDMTDDPERDGVTVSVQCRRDGKYLHLKRCGNVPYAFFHIELAPGNRYTYRVRALASQEKATGDYGTVKSGTIQVGKPTVSITLSESGKPQLTWEAVEGAVAYQVYYATSKSGKYKLVETTESLTAIYEAAKSGKTAYFKVCAVDINGTAGEYSSKISIKSK